MSENSKTKDDIIKSVYFDRSGFQSIQKTYQDSKQKDASITLNDVKQWFSKHTQTKKQLYGYNSFINDEAFDEYQIDLAFFKSNEQEPCLVMIDIFSKYASAVPVKSKESVDVIVGVMECIKHIGKNLKYFTQIMKRLLNQVYFKNFVKKKILKLYILELMLM